MNQKVYHTLEYYKILERLADYASCEEAKDRCHKLVPLTDPAEIAHLQELRQTHSTACTAEVASVFPAFTMSTLP